MQKENLNESGRSMVEMLGVLAIIGVLTVVGITGFRHAILRHRANEMLNEASKRAAVVAGQLTMMGQATGNLNEFIQNDFGYGTFKTGTVTPQNGTFKIGIDNVPDDVCNQMQGMIGGAVIAMTPCTTGDDNSILLTYNNDLSADENNDEDAGGYARAPRPEDGLLADDGSTCTGERLGPCQICNQGVYVDSDAYCLSHGGGMCVDGACQKMAGCMTNGDCKTLDSTNCGSGECFCSFDKNVDSCTGPKSTGKCILKSARYFGSVTFDHHEYILGTCTSARELDWFSAKNFCAAYGKRMMTLEEVGCTTASCPTNSLLKQIYTALDGKDHGTWVLDTRSNCRADYPISDGRNEPSLRADGWASVLCY